MKPTICPLLLLPFLVVAAAPAVADVPEKLSDLYVEKLAPFYHGVASGDPLPDGFIIWTRVTQEGKHRQDKVQVSWKVATDRGLRNVVAQGNTFALKAHDYTVKVDVRGLADGQTYYYGFKSRGRESITGRARTAPGGNSDQLKFAVVSCSNYDWGYFSGYTKIAKRNDLDAVIHVGDYIYEYADNDSYSSPEVREERVVFPRKETVTLNQYRKRYANMHLDPNLRRAHKQHPFIAIWDDHEFANNAWKGGAKNHQPEDEGSWRKRKAAAKRAYFEWMPIRGDGERVYRQLRYGNLMDLILVDTRVEGRDKQIEDATDPLLYDPNRTMLGEKQKRWFKGKLAKSGAQWKVVANQVMFSEFNIGFAGGPLLPDFVLESQFLDIWDGYPAERSELVRFMERRNIENTVILTGDIHSSHAFEVVDPALGNPDYDPATGKGAVAVEFVTPSLSAANFDEEIGGFLEESIESRINTPDADGFNPNPHMKFADLDRHGYVVLTVEKRKVQADYYYLKSILKPKTSEEWGAGFITRAGTHHLVEASAPASAKTVQAAPAPYGDGETAED